MSVQREVGLFDAKTHLSELVQQVEAGASVTITRRGVPAARLVPVVKAPGRARAARRLSALGARLRRDAGGITVDELNQWRAQGRR
ncbi:MAG: type II toxin-antitoxin system prevent-host-death family antitoxin [Propioniciclava sp.]|uniref:type II toxin-antitoxin system Phd/YefM family antitoxin n=1 Tax=Propioniciclava sp. TaxID=2038686 RepID=UPI0039E29C74